MVMKTARFLCVPCVAVALFAVSATVQAADGLTPATNETCDSLAGEKPGLYGLCVALCEAQECGGTLNPDKTVTLDETCGPSADDLLRNYIKLARGTETPLPPCIEAACPCWSEPEIDNIGGYLAGDRSLDWCFEGSSSVGIIGHSTDGGGVELAYVIETSTGPVCQSRQTNPTEEREEPVDAPQIQKCTESIIEECNARSVEIKIIQ